MKEDQIKDIEKSLLGSIIANNDIIYEVLSHIAVQDFYIPAHQKIFTVMIELSNLGDVIDEITIKNQLDIKKQLDSCGGSDYLMQLYISSVIPENAVHHSKIIKEFSTKRGLNNILQGKIKEIQEVRNVEETIENLRKLLDDLSKTASNTEIDVFKELYLKEMDVLERKSRGEISANDRITTGYKPFDSELGGGLCLGQFTIVGGRPAQGKTSLVVNMMMHMAEKGIPVLFLSLEQPKDQLSKKMISIKAKVPYQSLISGELTAENYDSMFAMCEKSVDIPFYIDDEVNNEFEITSAIRRAIRLYDVKVVAIDYLQRVAFTGKSSDNRHQDIGNLAINLANLAKRLNINIIGVTQLNRNVDHRKTQEPILSDLAESGTLEQAADRVILIYRDEYYMKEMSERPNEADLIIAKNRFGGTNNVLLGYEGSCTRFYEM